MANDYIEMLKERDTARAMKRYRFVDDMYPPFDICPVCGTAVASNMDIFCRMCGQRFDRDNYEFQ